MTPLSTSFLDFNSVAELRSSIRQLRSSALDLVGRALIGNSSQDEKSFEQLEKNLPEQLPNIDPEVKDYQDLGKQLAKQHIINPREINKDPRANPLVIIGKENVDYNLEPVAFKNNDSKHMFSSLVNTFFELLEIRKTVSDTPDGEEIKKSIDKYLSRMLDLGKGVLKSFLPEELSI